ncbi:unnamed protein product [Triticum aestivum]|uniref:RBR-type E3 ubiquitin transferase n=2 Tax=Triticum aestivum TaxID=4565 RepID=A0A9R1JE75_WHEAT|nr:probable E3 ubiquitin-protein ligase ARI1 [Triticum aestivum]KAF7014260.1 hypothetical protein CFC21_028276 [Triticum aestivum]SPT16494.1 unnamed protein product [Triticum aestivum]
MGSTISRCGRGGEGPAHAEEAGGCWARRSSGGGGGGRVGGWAEELRRWRNTAARRLGGGAPAVEEDDGRRLGGGATAVEEFDGRRSGGGVPRRPTDGGRVDASRGRDSRVHGHGELFYCPMCMELVPINLKSSLGPCGHAFCSSCVTTYVAVKQREREDAARVKCPDCENGVPVFVTEGGGDLPADGHGEPFECAICMETVPGALKFSVSPCGHPFCRSCVARYVAAKLDDKVAGVACPHPGCEAGAVEPSSCRGVIPPDLLDRWGFLLCELAVGAKRVYCPYQDCSALLLADADTKEAIAEAECPHCHQLFCARCGVPWHDGLGCEEFQKLGQDERGRNELLLRRLVGRKGWQRCPKCRMFVEKSEGCNYMKCRCGNSFCYRCASKLSAENHYCKKCKR